MLRYDAAWSALNLLIRSGKPFSGHERNCAFLNLGGTTESRFANVSAATGLDFDDDGRGLAYTDWDGDGDLDLWITNRNGPRVRFVRNDTPQGDGKHWVACDLRGTRANRDAIGARVELHMDGEPVPRLRTLTAGHGHLSQSTKTLHFGLGADAPPVSHIVVRWPGTAAETFPGVSPGQRYLLEEGSGVAVPSPPPAAPAVALAEPGPPVPPPHSDAGRIVVLRPGLLPPLEARDLSGAPLKLNGERSAPLLINLWATWCAPCVGEMREWAGAEDAIRRSGLTIVSVSVDDTPDKIRAFVKKHGYPFETGIPGAGFLDALDTVQRAYIGRQTDLPLPSSFLVDARGRVAAIYRGPVSSQQLLDDLPILGAPAREVVAAAIPFDGHWIDGPMATNPNAIAAKFVEQGKLAEAVSYADFVLARGEAAPSLVLDTDRISLHRIRAAALSDLGDTRESLQSWRAVTELAPDDHPAWHEIARGHSALGEKDEAAGAIRRMLEIRPGDAEAMAALGGVLVELGRPGEAATLYEQALTQAPSPVGYFKLSSALAASRDMAGAVAALDRALDLQPGWPPAANNLAWILATSPDDQLHDGPRAVELATAACEASSFKIPGAVSTLAAAYARAGRFEDAVATNRKAIGLAAEAADPGALERFEARQKLYESGRTFTDAALAPQ